MVMITLYERQQKRHRCIEQNFGTQMYRTEFWILCERERVGWFGRMALKHVYYQVRNELPVQVRYRIQDAWGWCTGMTQRDDMGRVVGGGFRIGNSCTLVADSCQCMAKPIQYCKVQLKKKRKNSLSHEQLGNFLQKPLRGTSCITKSLLNCRIAIKLFRYPRNYTIREFLKALQSHTRETSL